MQFLSDTIHSPEYQEPFYGVIVMAICTETAKIQQIVRFGTSEKKNCHVDAVQPVF
jgi:hypothetical protein